jgi:hypothetical protein
METLVEFHLWHNNRYLMLLINVLKPSGNFTYDQG